MSDEVSQSDKVKVALYKIIMRSRTVGSVDVSQIETVVARTNMEIRAEILTTS